MTGLCATVLVGFAALAIDTGSWQVAQRSMQGAADAAAYSAAIAYNKKDGTSYVTQAKGIAAAARYVDGQNGVTVSVNTPPTSGAYTGIANKNIAFEVIIQQPQPRFFAGLFLASDPTVNARAVGRIAPGAGNGCILALSQTANPAITVNGSANLDSNGCDVVSNSNSATAIKINGSATITTPCAVTAGGTPGVALSGSASLDLTTCAAPTTGAALTADPYASVPEPTPSGSCLAPVISGNHETFSAGRYCSGISVSGSNTASFGAGVYYIDGGNFSVSGSATDNGTGVTFFVAAPYATSLSGSSSSTFTAPTSGAYSGIVFFGDRGATGGPSDAFSGSGTLAITGAMYFPTQSVNVSGSFGSASNCTQLIGDTITVSGSATFNKMCDGTGVANIIVYDGTPGTVQLAE